MPLGRLKQLSISLGLYPIARSFHRRFIASDHERFTHQDHLQLLRQFIRQGDLAFDVGANIGEKTDIMLSVGAKVIAYEPQPYLAREVAQRGGKSRLTVIASAVGATPGDAELMLTDSTGMASIRPDWDQSQKRGSIKVPVTTLDHEIKVHGLPVFCKIDVEGFEVDVLKGLSSPIKALSFEYHRNPEAIERVHQCVAELHRLGNYEFNLTGTEGGKLLSPRWMKEAEFVATFPGCTGEHFYGDIFARISAS